MIEVEINLKDNIWRGTGTGSTEAEAAWVALQDCIDNWQADVGVHLLPRWVRSRLRRPR